MNDGYRPAKTSQLTASAPALDRFNTIDESKLRLEVRACLAIDRWVDEVVSGRPYADRESAVSSAQRAALPFTRAEVEGALQHHPRIGDRLSGHAPEETGRSEGDGVTTTTEAAQGAGVTTTTTAAQTTEAAQMTEAVQAAMSRAEQSGVDPANTELADRLRARNAAYEQRFGHVFLIAAAGRAAPEILDQLEQRITRTPDQEWATTAEELRKIAVLRLQRALRS